MSNAADVLARIYEDSYEMLVGFATKQLRENNLNVQFAEDVVQDVAVGFLQANPEMRIPEQVRDYLCRSIVHAVIAMAKDPALLSYEEELA